MIGIKRIALCLTLALIMIPLYSCEKKNNGNVTMVTDETEYDSIAEMAYYYIGGPVLDEFNEDNYLPVIYFCTAKMISDSSNLIKWTDREGCAFVSVEVLSDYIDEYFDVPEDIVSYLPMGQINNSSEIYRANGKVFFFDSFHPTGGIEIKKIEKDENAVYVYCYSSAYDKKEKDFDGGARRPFMMTFSMSDGGRYRVLKVEPQ